ncbi:testis, prostate and placenta-expressed protein-like [Crassostrea angulata]|uniref:TEPP protein n=2 Tax=Magallana gigas TaxID=29159 RepID=A0A8W8K0A2_MAGGI|nr:testis, prostate and placenta-expressed protein [Crassostrea gigas]XP_052715411.1 testis, prostate and placenta-expressed protein-like [Crassostrea angulata]
MTTVSVDPVQQGAYPMKIPSYSYQYPSHRRVQLAAVKEGLFHPRLPSFRRMDMDTAGHKLPDEHCRTTTSCGPDDFRRSTSTMLEPPVKNMSGLEITSTGKQLHKHYTTPEELKRARTEWSDFLNRSPERFNIQLPSLPSSKDQRFVGYAVRYLRPEVTKSWNYTLRQEPSLDQYGQKPIPANIYARYRDTYPQYSRNIASEAWR